MNEKIVANTTGLNQRGAFWYVRVVVPPPLRPSFGKSRYNVATGHTDKRQANVQAAGIRAEWLAKFAQKERELSPQPLPAVSPEMVLELAQRVHASALRDDDRIRSDLPLLAEMVHVRRELDRKANDPAHVPQWVPPEARKDDLTGLRDGEAHELMGLNEHLSKAAASALSKRNLAAVLSLVQAEARVLGLSFDHTAPGGREALEASLKAYRAARHEVTQRDSGEVIHTPVLSSTPTATINARTLRGVYLRWKDSGDSTKSADTVAACGRALALFEGFAPESTLKGITRAQGDEFRTWISKQSNTSKTARDRLNWIKSLLKYAAETLEWIPKHPWAGISITVKTEAKRRPWEDPELKLLFKAPLTASYALPTAWNAGKDAAYWIPLLGLFTGARLGELCQLRVMDIRTVESLPVLVVTNEGVGQKVKSCAGHRSIPIHSELIRLGFLEYVASVRPAGEASLWPSLKFRKGKPSGYFSRWFSDYRKGLGLGALPDFHCFRHTVRPLMRRAGISETTMDKVTGHESGGSVGTVVYDHWTLGELKQAVECIKYPFLSLPVVSPHGGPVVVKGVS